MPASMAQVQGTVEASAFGLAGFAHERWRLQLRLRTPGSIAGQAMGQRQLSGEDGACSSSGDLMPPFSGLAWDACVPKQCC